MIRTNILWLCALYFISCLAADSAFSADIQDIIWKDVSRGIISQDIQTVAISPDNADVVYISSLDALYKTEDSGKKWDEILSFRATGNSINAVAITPANTNIVYAGTDDGLYRSADKGMRWEKIFSGIGEAERVVLFIAVDPEAPNIIYIGGRTGLFFTKNNGIDWGKGRNLPPDSSVRSIVIDHVNSHIIYAAADKGLYKSADSGAGWARILKADFTAEDITSSDMVETDEINEIMTGEKINSAAVDPADSRTVYVGTSQGLLVSGDAGATWKAKSSLGLGSRDIRHIVVHPSDTGHLYAATGSGFFRYSKTTESWEELYRGIVTSDSRYLAVAPTAHNGAPVLWAVTKRNVYQSFMPVSAPVEQNIISRDSIIEAQEALSKFNHEPSIEEIRDAAIAYAEVQPEKIEKWRRAASYRALLPDLRFDYDKGKDWQSDGYYYYGKYVDDEITKGRDKGWSISLTWELGDLIWSDDQTSIDTRSRLMVQLRDDVLNEVTRLYFERRRLQVELLLSLPVDINDRIEKDLRLQELTANIDALTGSYLSKKIGK